MHQLDQDKELAKTFVRLTHKSEKHNFNTRSDNQNLLDIPLNNTTAYGTSSCKIWCIKDQNKFKKSITKLNHGKLSYAKVKSLLTSQMFQGYK